ncbi:hypothetical protein I4U23_011658 [Adineta vaga]|nr:hypothetical protein I4U23_011658 [Adineta vaga]
MSTIDSNDKIISSYIDEPPINNYIENFFANYASIPAADLREHLINVRKRAWENYNYPCLGRWSFLDFSIQRSPIYKEIIEKCKNEGATVIDFGCCLGQDIRQLIYEGVSIDQIRGYELDPTFIQQGYELFHDEELMKKKNIITPGDIFDNQFLDAIQPADYLYVGSFIHLFDSETQKEVCRRLSRLCKQAITGRQVGASVPMERFRSSGPEGKKRMCHSPESFARMWIEVTNSKWEVESATLQTRNDTDHPREILTFVVRKKTIM